MVDSQESPGGEGASGTHGAPRKVTFHYVKSNFYRVVHADGVWGGVTPSADIQMSFWNQRQAIPERIVHEVGTDGTVGKEIERSGKEFVREVEVSVVMDLEEAKSFRNWLDDKIRALEEALAQRRKKDQD